MKYHCLKYRLMITHSKNHLKQDAHGHVFEIELFLETPNAQFFEFSDMEQCMERALAPYQQKYLNDFPVFEGDTSLENVGEVIWKEVVASYAGTPWEPERLEISETPLRVYAISTSRFERRYGK